MYVPQDSLLRGLLLHSVRLKPSNAYNSILKNWGTEAFILWSSNRSAIFNGLAVSIDLYARTISHSNPSVSLVSL